MCAIWARSRKRKQLLQHLCGRKYVTKAKELCAPIVPIHLMCLNIAKHDRRAEIQIAEKRRAEVIAKPKVEVYIQNSYRLQWMRSNSFCAPSAASYLACESTQQESRAGRKCPRKCRHVCPKHQEHSTYVNIVIIWMPQKKFGKQSSVRLRFIFHSPPSHILFTCENVCTSIFQLSHRAAHLFSSRSPERHGVHRLLCK